MVPASTSLSIGEKTKNAALATGSGIWSAIRSQHPTLHRHKHLLYVIGGVVIGLTGLGVYLLWTKSASANKLLIIRKLEQAEKQKEEGNAAFKARNHELAIGLFRSTIQLLREVSEALQKQNDERWRDLMATCENNIAASYFEMKDIVKCVVHCNAAIALKPSYAKALLRRGRCFALLDQNVEALEDFFDLITSDDVDSVLQPQQMAYVQTQMDNVAEAIIKPECEALTIGLSGEAKKIPQGLVATWQYDLFINDPLLLRCAALDEKKSTPTTGLDQALVALKKRKYDEIAELASAIANDDQQEPLERAQAALLAARFLTYQALSGQAKQMAERFEKFWEQLDEVQKDANKDLKVAHIILQMALHKVGSPLAEVDKQWLAQKMQEAIQINPNNVDPLLFHGHIMMSCELFEEALSSFQEAKKVHKDHPFLRYYEIYVGFLLAVKQAHMARIHSHILEMHRAFDESDGKPPLFALLLMTKIGISMSNNDLALDFAKQAVQQMPNNAYAIFLYGMLDQPPPNETTSSADQAKKYMQKLEKKMHKAIEADPNSWEPYRMLAKICMHRHDFVEAKHNIAQALFLVRERDEMMVLLKERLMIRLFEKRASQNKRMPRGMLRMVDNI